MCSFYDVRIKMERDQAVLKRFNLHYKPVELHSRFYVE